MESLSVRSKEVGMLLSLGATSWEAAHELIHDALRTSMIPTLNSIMVMGIVSLPKNDDRSNISWSQAR